MSIEGNATGFDFTLKARGESFSVIAIIHSAKGHNGKYHWTVDSQFRTLEQAEGCFAAHEKTAKKHGFICVGRTPIPQDENQDENHWESESNWRKPGNDV